MDVNNILNQKNAQAAAVAIAHQHLQQQQQHQHHHHHQHHQQHVTTQQHSVGLLSHQMAQIPSMTQMVLGSDRPDSPHGSEHSRFSTPQIPPPQMPPYGNSPTVMAAQLPSSMPPQMHMLAPMAGGMPPQAPPAPQKQYSCSTCPKSFTRRSDLARHERIHSGVRPHACEHPGCGKRFIQRSALTVHVRVHTGEKPHMCEHCSKTFSDSSSLARHRRIHSGKRPYKCPYADCQKTFTRRTTLTRHQNHHTGTVEEAAAQTRAALAAARAKTQSEAGDHMSGHPSPMSTPSPNQTRPLSTSPSLEIAGTPNSLQREFPALSHLNQPGLPTHVRNDIYHSGPAQTSAPYNQPMRPTSHPMSFPPPTLEPSAEPSHSNPGSQTGSPHMSHVSGGWQSPQPGAQSPAHSQPGGAYTYPEPDYAANAYFQSAAGIRRPDSAQSGSGGYDVKPRNEVWAGAH